METRIELSRAIRTMMAQEGLTQKKLAAAAGYKTVSAVSTPLKNEDMMLSTLARLAKAAGYSVCLVKNGANLEYYPPIKVLVSEKRDEDSGV